MHAATVSTRAWKRGRDAADRGESEGVKLVLLLFAEEEEEAEGRGCNKEPTGRAGAAEAGSDGGAGATEGAVLSPDAAEGRGSVTCTAARVVSDPAAFDGVMGTMATLTSSSAGAVGDVPAVVPAAVPLLFVATAFHCA